MKTIPLPKRKETTKKKGKKKQYKIRNWREYNESLVRRGSLEFWGEKDVIKEWAIAITGKNGKRKRGAQQQYSSHAIEICRLIGKVFH
jgi:hypothetical protein